MGRSRGSEGVTVTAGEAGNRVQTMMKRQSSAEVETFGTRKRKGLPKKARELGFKWLCSPYGKHRCLKE